MEVSISLFKPLPRWTRLGFGLGFSGIADGVGDKVAIARYCVACGLSHVRRREPSPVTFRLAGGLRVTVSDRSELLAMNEILRRHEYDFAVQDEPRTVIDAGANVG